MQLNGSRKVIGVLRGYDVNSSLVVGLRVCLANLLKVFLNIVLDDAVEEKDGGEKVRLGMVVSLANIKVVGIVEANVRAGHTRQFCCHARSSRENWRRKRRQRMRGGQHQAWSYMRPGIILRGLKVASGFMAFTRFLDKTPLPMKCNRKIAVN